MVIQETPHCTLYQPGVQTDGWVKCLAGEDVARVSVPVQTVLSLEKNDCTHFTKAAQLLGSQKSDQHPPGFCHEAAELSVLVLVVVGGRVGSDGDTRPDAQTQFMASLPHFSSPDVV